MIYIDSAVRDICILGPVTIIIVLTGMVEVLNAAGLDYVCWGNHESDVPFYSMLDRIRESK